MLGDVQYVRIKPMAQRGEREEGKVNQRNEEKKNYICDNYSIYEMLYVM